MSSSKRGSTPVKGWGIEKSPIIGGLHSPRLGATSAITGNDRLGVKAPTLRTYLQYEFSQIECIPCHSSRGGAGDVPRGRKGLYAALKVSYISRASASASAARAASIVCASCELQPNPSKRQRVPGDQMIAHERVQQVPVTRMSCQQSCRNTSQSRTRQTW